MVNEVPPRGRGIAMVFQSYGLYPHLRVRSNIAFPLKTQGTPNDESSEGRMGRAAARHRRACSSASRASSPAASASGWRSRGRWCASPRCSCSTSRSPTSTPSCAPARATRSSSSSGHRHHHDLRDARPGRGDGHGRPHRRDRARQVLPGRDARRDLRRSGGHLRRDLPRHAADESGQAQGGASWASGRTLSAPGTAARRRADATSRSPSERIEYLGNERILYGFIDGQATDRIHGTDVVTHFRAGAARRRDGYPFAVRRRT